MNCAGNLMRGVGAAAVCISLSSIATPADAAPPTDTVVSGPTEAPPASGPSVWDALVDHAVVFTLKDGLTIRGTVLSVTNDVLVCAREVDGLMVVIDAEQIAFVHVEKLHGKKALKKPETGQPLIVLGSIAVAVGGGLGVAALGLAASCYDDYGGICGFMTLPLAAAGMAHLSLGIPFLSSGLRKRKNLRAAKAAAVPAVSAFLVPSRTGAMAGVGLRF
jgi:hypothetical protein